MQNRDNYLDEERKNASFNLHKLSVFFYGSEEYLSRRKFIANLVESAPEFNDETCPINLSREERYENALRKTVAMSAYIDQIDITSLAETNYFQKLALSGDMSPLHLHYVMFIPTLMRQCDAAQTEKWLPLAYSHQIIGTYAQTELGHGTNLKRLETVAVYDKQSDEFILSTPTLTSTKWWPGNLGKTANYVIVIAQLYIEDKHCGIHPFLVQIRSLEDHKPLAGVTVGDIGAKFGYNSNDNGFLRLEAVRIPRRQMLMRHAKVTRDGVYAAPKTVKSVYSSMMFVRSVMACDQAMALATAGTIAARYSCVRRQGDDPNNSGKEMKIIDYQTQQHRIIPHVVLAIAYYLAGRKLFDMYSKVDQMMMSRGDASLLPQLHALSAGLKACSSFDAALGIEQCRLACGGHGYLAASGFPQLYADIVAGCTYEGDNLVLLLQVARSLMKLENGKFDELTEYLKRPPNFSYKGKTKFICQDLLLIFENSARRHINNVSERLKQPTVGFDAAWSQNLVRLTKCAKAHVLVFVMRNFMEHLQNCCDESIKHIVENLCTFFGLYIVYSRRAYFSQELSESDFDQLSDQYFRLLSELRREIVPLVDAFDLQDRELRSCLGRHDGRVYESLFESAQKSPLNKKEVLDCHFKYLLNPTTMKAKL